MQAAEKQWREEVVERELESPICWLLQSSGGGGGGGEVVVREREGHLLASAKQWGERGGERDKSPICWLLHSSGGKEVVERE